MTRSLLLGLTFCAFCVAPAAAQEFRNGPINFVLWSNGPGQSFDRDLWLAAFARLGPTYEHISLFTTDPARIPETLETVHAARPPQTMIAMTVGQLNTDDPAVFAEAMANFDAQKDAMPDLAGSVTLLDVPLCRAMQTVMSPTDYAPYTMVFHGTGDQNVLDCYMETAKVLFRRAEGYDLDAEGNRIIAVDETAASAQDAMPPLYSMGHMLVDTNDPDRATRRETNVFAPGDEVVIRTTLDYVRKSGAGYPGARLALDLDVEIKAPDGTLVERIDDVYRYDSEVRHRVPIDAEYFRNWLVAGIRVQEPGEYKVAFLFTDLNAHEDKQVPVPIEVDVVVQK